MSRAEDDDIEARIAAFEAAQAAAEARHLTGAEARLLRDAIEAAAGALALINIKGLPFAHRREVEAARAQLERARPLLAKRVQPAERAAG